MSSLPSSSPPATPTRKSPRKTAVALIEPVPDAVVKRKRKVAHKGDITKISDAPVRSESEGLVKASAEILKKGRADFVRGVKTRRDAAAKVAAAAGLPPPPPPIRTVVLDEEEEDGEWVESDEEE
ncbi:hypothetical protein P7C70_g271, partial [Phenoliferia sp. Uapishka_3]